MLKILVIFLILVAGFFLGPLLQGHQGSAIFVVANYKISMSFISFVILLILTFLCFYLIYWFIKKIFNSKTTLGRWLRLKSPHKAVKRIEQAQIFLLEGNYQQAAKLFMKSAKGATNTTLSYLLAAQAQIENDELIPANQLLEQAAKSCQPRELFAFQLVQLRLQIKNHEYDAAQILIERLLNEKPRNPEVLRLADQLYYETANYQAVIDLLPIMYKTKVYSESQLDQFKQAAYIGRIKQLTADEDPQQLINWWKSQPRAILNNLSYQKAMIYCLKQLGQTDEADKLQVAITKIESQERT
ncbi:heme biosynthesis HemY N-terminal domain-containing protein [uncultured Gilliamella sp.]|uniref:heme biosynthesis HemY N-terminal domain-containing protein n=1 Tax=uncultured Gilliamella sp. TaxID=1193505 RepID=UPI0025DAB93F|nr:heme biosynthesis HemY N-terminal domain-containing protein [uncultured Gilliamella sp.]